LEDASKIERELGAVRRTNQQRERAHVSHALDAVPADLGESRTRLREEADPVVPHARLQADEGLRSPARIPEPKAGRRPGRLQKDVVVGEERRFAFGGQPSPDVERQAAPDAGGGFVEAAVIEEAGLRADLESRRGGLAGGLGGWGCGW